MTMPPLGAVLVSIAALAVVVLQLAILREAYRRPYPEVIIFTHKVAEGSVYAFHIRDLFEKAGWRIKKLGTTDLPQHALGVWLHGGTGFEREMAKWGLGRFGVVPQIDYKDDNPKCLQVIVGQLNVVPPKGESQAQPSFPAPTVEMLERGRQTQIAQIAKWRAMAIDIHREKQAAKKRPVRGLLEEHPEYPSLRALLSDEARNIIEGMPEMAPMARVRTLRLSESTYPIELRVALDEIDRIAKQWHLE